MSASKSVLVGRAADSSDALACHAMTSFKLAWERAGSTQGQAVRQALVCLPTNVTT